MKQTNLWLGIFLTLLFAQQTVSASPYNPGNDFDGDGYSDMVLVSIGDAGALNWRVVSGATGQEIFQKNAFGVAGNHLALARWRSSSQSNAAVIALSGNTVSWKVLLDGGAVYTRNFAKKRNLLIAGADFDGDGIADAAAVSTGADGRMLWSVRRNFLSGVAAARMPRRLVRGKAVKASVSRFFGQRGDTPFFMDPDGRGDWAAVLKQDGKSVELLNIHSGRGRRIKLKNVDVGNLRPLVLKAKGSRDTLAFVRRTDSATELTLVSVRGTVLRRTELSGSGELLAGRFTDSINPQLALQDDASFSLYNVTSGTSDTRVWGDGIAADDLNINALQAQVEPTPEPTVAGPPPDNAPPPSGSISEICTHLHPMDRSVLYKPGSQDTGGTRAGRPMFMWYDESKNPHIRSLYVLANNGQHIATFGFYWVSPAPWVRFYSGYSPGTFETNARLKREAISAADSSRIYFYTKNGHCWGPVRDPLLRAGRPRYG